MLLAIMCLKPHVSGCMAEFCVTLDVVNTVRHHAKLLLSQTDRTRTEWSLCPSFLRQSDNTLKTLD